LPLKTWRVKAMPDTSPPESTSPARKAGSIPTCPETSDGRSLESRDIPSSCAAPTAVEVGERCLGQFRVLQRHAEGGFGQVSLAFDGRLCRQIALKEIRPDRRDDPAVRQRFLREAEITGQLQHPGIVPVYALENDETGQPYYAMRFIHGRTLAEAIDLYHADPSLLAFNDLLRRLVTVCQTVAYVHSKDVVHRDLKPANIMLGEYGETLILDWGLAKRTGHASAHSEPARTSPGPATDPETTQAFGSAAPDGELTLAGQTLGTPAYMAPEQADGDPDRIGPSTDIYALGAILYHVLTGQSPYPGRSAVEVISQVREGPPEIPSRVRRGVPPGLEAICLKAMERHPCARYATAAELAEEIERWLADEPVHAYPEPAGERIARWVRRNRMLAIGAVLFLLLALPLAVALAVVSDQARRRADTDRQRIEEEQKKADRLAERRRKVSKFYETHVLESARPRGEGIGRDVTLMEALDKARGEIGRSFEDQPEDEAAACTALGETYFTLGEYGPAEDLLLRAVDLRLRVLGEGHPDTVQSWLSLTDVLMETGRALEAKGPLRRLLTLLERSPGKEDRLTLSVRFNLLMVMYLGGEEADFIALWNGLLQDQRRILGENHGDTVMTRNNIGWTLLRKENRPAEARDHFAALIRDLDARPGLNRRAWMYATNGLGVSLTSLGDYNAAEATLARLLAVQEQELGRWARDTLRTRTNLATVLLDRGDFAEAEKRLRENESSYVAHYGADYPDLFGSVYPALIQCLKKLGKPGPAAVYERRLEEAKRKNDNTKLK
jgi:serine/threonine protein kinase